MTHTSRHRRYRPVGALVACLAMIASGAILAPADAASSRAQRLKNADKFYGMKLKDFRDYAKGARAGKKKQYDLDWAQNGCSVSSALVASIWKTHFKTGCIRHDFGYRNFGTGLKAKPDLALRSTNAKKLAVDKKMLADLRWLCRNKTRPMRVDPDTGFKYRATLDQCYAVADTMYKGVRTSRVGKINSGWNPENNWHGMRCTPGALCLFDDKDFKDRRLTFGASAGYPADTKATSSSNLKDQNFGDKTSSVSNRSGRAWKLYKHSGFKGESRCIPAHTSRDGLGGFGDETSSVKRLATKHC